MGTLVRHPRDLTGLRGDGKGELVAYRISLFRLDSLMMCTNRTIDRVPIHPRPLWAALAEVPEPPAWSSRKKEKGERSRGTD